MANGPGHPHRSVRASALAELREHTSGAVLVPADDGYPDAHAVWNRDRQSRPAVIVQPADTDDVQTAVRFAREHALPITVRGAGYSPAGLSSGTGLVVDLRGLRRVRIDPVRQRVVVQGGARWGDVDEVTQRFRRVVPGVAMGDIGVAGSTLGGGFGHLRRAYGLACDNLLGAEVVTADGKLVTTSGDETPELLWGLRGGGGNFGVVTSLTFRLRPLPGPVLSGTVIFPGEHAPGLLRFYREWAATLPDDIATGVTFFGRAHSPALTELIGLVPSVPLVGVTVVCMGPPVEAAALVRPLLAAGPVLRDLIVPRPYTAYQAMRDAEYPAGWSAAMDSGYHDDLDDEVIAALCERHAAMVPSSCELRVQHMGGAVGRVARMSTAVPNRNARFLFTALARWRTPDQAAEYRDWLGATGERLAKYAVGGPNIGLRSAAMSSIVAYGAERYLRLAALKRRFDPDNVFRGNQNVAPLR